MGFKFRMKTPAKFIVVAMLLAAVALTTVQVFPEQAEQLSQKIVTLWFLATILALFVAACRAPASRGTPLAMTAVGLGSFAVVIAVGTTLHPLETRNGGDVHPGPRPAGPNVLVDLLQHPWSSLKIEHLPIAPLLVRCSEVAYEAPVQWETSIPRLGFSKHVPLDKGSAKGVVMIVGTEAVIAFQGTDGFDDVGDWFTNLDKKLARPPNDPVHSGFLKAYRSVADQVHQILAENGITHVWVTGHSLGGAMAVLCALDLERTHDVRIRGVITFGQPLLLEPKFARTANSQLDDRFLRIIHRDDIVPCVVPGLRGGGSYVWFQEGGLKFGQPLMTLYAGRDGDDAPSENDDEGPKRLTDRQFDREKAKVLRQMAPPPEGESTLAQGLPNSTDHKMEKYVEVVTNHFGPIHSRIATGDPTHIKTASPILSGRKR